MTTADTQTRLDDQEKAIADLYRNIESLRNRLALHEALVQRQSQLLVLKTLPANEDCHHHLAGVIGNTDARLRKLEQHFRPWPNNHNAHQPGCGC